MSENEITLVESFLELPFLLSVPKRHPLRDEPAGRDEQSGKLPVLCFLHGLGEGAPIDIYTGLTAHGPLKPGSSTLAASEFIVAAPQLPLRGDFWHSYAGMVGEMVQYLHSTTGGDPARTYLTGFSFGGNGVFDIALLTPSLWAALWPVDPTRVPDHDPGVPIWLSSGEASRPNGPGFIKRLRLLPPGAGPDDRIFTDERLNHVGTATSAYSSDTVYNWLLSKHL